MALGSDSEVLLFIVNIAGAAALLIWAVRMVRTGVERAFVVQLRAFLRGSSRNRLQAGFSGLIAAICLQSATAVAVLVANFSSKGGITVSVGLAILLGADVGSALVSQFMILRLDMLPPILLLTGVALFLKGRKNETKQVGRILIGVALIFVSLGMIRFATAPLMENPATLSVMGYLGGDLLTAFLIGAGFAWIVHSSVAAVLLFVTLATQGLLPLNGAVAMVLGANAGGALIAYTLTLSSTPSARRMVLANLVLRGGGAILVLFCIPTAEPHLNLLGASDGSRAINVHLLFNVGVFLVAVPFLAQLGSLFARLIPDEGQVSQSRYRTTALDTTALDDPDRALNCVAREVLQLGEHSESLLRSVVGLYNDWDRDLALEIKEQAKTAAAIHEEIKRYLAQIDYSELNEAQKQTSDELAANARNLEAAARCVSRDLFALAKNLDIGDVSFSKDGKKEIEDFHDRVLSNAQLALSVLMNRAPDEARQVIYEKEKLRQRERELQQLHLSRLRAGRTDSFETSQVHQESLRKLKEINAYFTAIVQPIALRSGDLLASRLSVVRADADDQISLSTERG